MLCVGAGATDCLLFLGTLGLRLLAWTCILIREKRWSVFASLRCEDTGYANTIGISFSVPFLMLCTFLDIGPAFNTRRVSRL